MENKKIPYLCGGTLFFLLVQAKKPRAKAREREKGVVDRLKDPTMMEGLILAITGNKAFAYPESLKKNTSQFRECKIDGSAYIPFNNSATANSYDYEITNSYSTALSRMDTFAADFLDPSKTAWLVRVLIDVIDQDAGISDTAHFCIQSDGTFLSKSDVLSTMHFELQPFLIGIIHYILMNRSDNISGQDTLDAWGIKASERNERKLKEDFSLGKSRTITVDWYKPDEERDFKDADESILDKEYVEAEVVEEYTDEAEKDRVNATSQSVFINNRNGVQIGINYGTINLSSHKTDKDS